MGTSGKVPFPSGHSFPQPLAYGGFILFFKAGRTDSTSLFPEPDFRRAPDAKQSSAGKGRDAGRALGAGLGCAEHAGRTPLSGKHCDLNDCSKASQTPAR